MSTRNKKALVLWTREGKAGIESLCNVPENARFVGAVTPVLFRGDKKHYPAKVLMISDDDKALEAMADEVALQILKDKLAKEQEKSKAPTRQRRSTKKAVNPSLASDRELSLALGEKLPLPAHLQPALQAAQKAAKEGKAHHSQGQKDLNEIIMGTMKKNLFNVEKSKGLGSLSFEREKEENDSEDEDASGLDGSCGSDGEGPDVASSNSKSHDKWCGCSTCTVLQKYDSPNYQNFLQDLSKLFKSVNNGKKLYLELLEISPDVKQVELTSNSGVFIPHSVKEQIKVDYRNKPTSLIRETLYALYGKEAFKVLTVTAKGTREGSYGIPDNVLKAVLAFVNRHVSKEQALSTTSFNQKINKRAPEWRKSPKSLTKTKSSSKKKAVSTSPVKVTSFEDESVDSSANSTQKRQQTAASSHKHSPLKDGGSTAQPSPVKSTPSKRQRTATPNKHSPFKRLDFQASNTQPSSPAKSTPNKRRRTSASPFMHSPSKGLHQPSPAKTPHRGQQAAVSPFKNRPSPLKPSAVFGQMPASTFVPMNGQAGGPMASASVPSCSYDPSKWNGFNGDPNAYGDSNSYGYPNFGNPNPQGNSIPYGNHFSHMPWMNGNDYWVNNGPAYNAA